MKFRVALLAFNLFFSANLLAQYNGGGHPNDRDNHERDVDGRQLQRKASRLQQLIIRKADTLSQREKQMLNRALTRATKIINGEIDDIGPGPGPGPAPLPPRPVACSSDHTADFQQTFIEIKDFAYSMNGLNMSSSGARSYAQTWVEKYPCEYAPEFISNFKVLKDFAYSMRGLNLSSSSARNYAIDKVDTFCTDFPIQSEFKKHYDFAYSMRGLNMSSSAARNYAKEKVEQIAFSCFNF